MLENSSTSLQQETISDSQNEGQNEHDEKINDNNDDDDDIFADLSCTNSTSNAYNPPNLTSEAQETGVEHVKTDDSVDPPSSVITGDIPAIRSSVAGEDVEGDNRYDVDLSEEEEIMLRLQQLQQRRLTCR